MGSKATLLATAALAIGLAAPADAQTTEAPGAKSDITITKEAIPSTGDTQSEGANNESGASVPPVSAGANKAGDPSTGSEGATNKTDMKEGKLPSSSSTY